MISREAVCVRRQGDRDPRRPASERALRRHADGGAEAPAGPRDQAVDATAPQGAARQPKQARRKRRRPGGVVAVPQPGSWPRDLEGLRRGERIQAGLRRAGRSEEHTSELQSLMRNSYAVFCLNKNRIISTITYIMSIIT